MKRATRKSLVTSIHFDLCTQETYEAYTDILDSDAKQRATIRDLKARLEAVATHDCREEGVLRIRDAADLANKNWRTP